MKKTIAFQKLLAESMAGLNETDIFTHPAFVSNLNFKNHRLFREWNLPQIIVEICQEGPAAAWTNNKEIYINLGHELLKGTPQEVLQIILGLNFHEILHYLFTCFTACKRYSSSMLNGKLYPNDPIVTGKNIKRLEQLKAYIATPENARKVRSITQHLDNIIDDGRIEWMGQAYCSHHGQFMAALSFLRDKTYDDLLDFSALLEKQSKEDDFTEFHALQQLIFNYAKYGDIKGIQANQYRTALFKKFDSVSSYVGDAIQAKTSIKFYNSLNLILVSLWDEIETYLKNFQLPKNDAGNPKDESKAIASDLDSHTQGMSTLPINVSGGSGSDRKETALQMGKSNDSKKHSRLPYEKTTKLGDYGNGRGTFYDPSYHDKNSTENNLSKLMQTIEKEKANILLEEEQQKLLDSVIEEIDFGKAHANISICIHRPKVTKANLKEYASSADPYIKIGRQLAKKAMKPFEKEPTPIVLQNQYSGTKFHPDAVVKNNFRYFSKKVRHDDMAKLAVGVIVDESGSMEGRKVLAAKAAALCIYEFCHTANVPVSIYGHTTGGYYNVEMYVYCDWQKPDADDRYRLMNIKARHANRDGVPIRFVAERLLKQEEENKLLIIINDGQPSAPHYNGTAAEKDLQELISEYTKKKINICAAAIGDDKPHIKRIYGENRFLDISDLSQLPLKMAAMIQRRL